MTENPILTPREPLIPGGPPVNRTWWRWFETITQKLGKLSSPLVVEGNSILNSATVTSGGTISSPNLSAHTLVGNPTTTAAQPAEVGVDSTLGFVNTGSIGLATAAGQTVLGTGLLGQPHPLRLGGSLYIMGDLLTDAGGSPPSGGADDAALYALDDTRARAGHLEQQVSQLASLIMAMSARSNSSSSGSTTPVSLLVPLLNAADPPGIITLPDGNAILVPIT